jgi:hypothetical protein
MEKSCSPHGGQEGERTHRMRARERERERESERVKKVLGIRYRSHGSTPFI